MFYCRFRASGFVRAIPSSLLKPSIQDPNRPWNVHIFINFYWNNSTFKGRWTRERQFHVKAPQSMLGKENSIVWNILQGTAKNLGNSWTLNRAVTLAKFKYNTLNNAPEYRLNQRNDASLLDTKENAHFIGESKKYFWTLFKSSVFTSILTALFDLFIEHTIIATKNLPWSFSLEVQLNALEYPHVKGWTFFFAWILLLI